MEVCSQQPRPPCVARRRSEGWRSAVAALILWLWQWLAAPAAFGLPQIDIEALRHQSLLAPVQFLIADREADFETVRRSEAFAPLQAQDINQGISGRAAWLRVRLVNPGDVDKAWVLHHETSYLDHLSVWHADNDGDYTELHLSDRRAFYDRAVPFRILAFQHVTPAHGYTDLYLRLNFSKPDSLVLAVELWDAQLLLQSEAEVNLLQGAYFGMMLAFVSVAAVCALMLRQLLYVCYVGFLVCNTLLWAALNGYAFQYLWPQLPYLHNEGTHIIFLLMTLTAFQFSKELLSTRELFPRAHRTLSALQWVMMAAVGLRLLGVYTPVLVMAYLALAALSLLPILGWLAYRRGVVHARWYTAAWLVYSGCVVLSVMSATGLLPGWGMRPLVYTQAGSLLEALLLLVALGERLLRWDRERKSALDLAHRDPLTGLGNRRRLAQAFQAVASRRQSFFVALIDLDGFKQINDTYGHEAGDQVLKDLADLMRRHTRADDVCIRYGGEEFVILLRAPSQADARLVIERIRQEFEQSPSHSRAGTILHTLSAGLVAVTPTSAEGEQNLETWIAAADAALYRAKTAGRNRTEVWA